MDYLKYAAGYILDSLMDAGADCAQTSVAEGRIEEFNVDAGEFSLIRSVFNSSASMKVIKDSKKGTAAVNQLDKDTVAIAVKECMDAAMNGAADEAVTIASLTENADFSDGALKPDKEKFFDSVIKFTEDIKTKYPEIMVEQLIATYSYGKHVFSNTNGVLFTEEDGSYSVSVMYSAHRGDKTTSFNYFDIDFLDPGADIMALGDSEAMFRRAVKELDARQFTGKFCGTAVFSPSCLTDFISIITSSFTGDYALIEGTSPWKNKMGEAVADESFTLSVIPHDSRIVCGERITADGYKSENFDIIKDGILKSFCLSEYASRRTSLPRAKSTSGCIEVAKGEKSFEELISGIKEGILVCRFSGGEPANNGDFSGVAKNSFLIKDGRIDTPLSETMISGNMADMLMKISGITEETVNDGASVLPYVAFDGVTVSGVK